MDDDENLQFTGDSINSDAMPVSPCTLHKDAWSQIKKMKRKQHHHWT